MDQTEIRRRDVRRDQAAALRRAGVSMAAIAAELHVAHSTLHRWAAEDGWRLADLIEGPAVAAAIHIAGEPALLPEDPNLGMDDDSMDEADATEFDPLFAARAMLARAARLTARGQAAQAEAVFRLADRMLRAGADLIGQAMSREAARSQADLRRNQDIDDYRCDPHYQAHEEVGAAIDAIFAGEASAPLPYWAEALRLAGVTFREGLARRLVEDDDSDWWRDVFFRAHCARVSGVDRTPNAKPGEEEEEEDSLTPLPSESDPPRYIHP